MLIFGLKIPDGAYHVQRRLNGVRGNGGQTVEVGVVKQGASYFKGIVQFRFQLGKAGLQNFLSGFHGLLFQGGNEDLAHGKRDQGQHKKERYI